MVRKHGSKIFQIWHMGYKQLSYQAGMISAVPGCSCLCLCPHFCFITVWMKQHLFHQTAERSDCWKSFEVCISLWYHFPSRVRGRNVLKRFFVFIYFFLSEVSVSFREDEKMRRQSANKPFSLASHQSVGCSVGFFLHRHTYLHTCMYLFRRNMQSSFLLQQFQLSATCAEL